MTTYPTGNENVELATDTSRIAFGAVLEQDKKIMRDASRSPLPPTEEYDRQAAEKGLGSVDDELRQLARKFREFKIETLDRLGKLEIRADSQSSLGEMSEEVKHFEDGLSRIEITEGYRPKSATVNVIDDPFHWKI